VWRCPCAARAAHWAPGTQKTRRSGLIASQ
jgi:hypothetical protein